MRDSKRYEDIIDLPHYQSTKRPQMSNYDRAAQFSPFAALKGYEEEIKETARMTDAVIELDETRKKTINQTLVYLKEREKAQPEIEILYFEPDDKKEGGRYHTLRGRLKKVDEYEERLLLTDGEAIQFASLLELWVI